MGLLEHLSLEDTFRTYVAVLSSTPLLRPLIGARNIYSVAPVTKCYSFAADASRLEKKSHPLSTLRFLQSL